MPPPTLVISINAAWNIVNFRKGLIRGLQAAGYEVVALAPPDGYETRLAELGVRFVPLEMDGQGTSPLNDLRLLGRYVQALRRIRPQAFLGYTAKPNIFGSIAAHLLGIPVINNVAGLGTAFIRRGPLTRLVSGLYRFALRRSRIVFFQNGDDQAAFIAQGLTRPEQARLLPGSGIDLVHFQPAPATARSPGGATFLLVARLLWDKGVGEYVEAARTVRARHPNARFQLLGFLDVANRTAVPREEVDRWVAEGVVEYLGVSDDVRPFLAAADCVVLPSYREGMPRSLLEAAAMGKPLIATDVPGCRQIAREGQNGLLCQVRDAPGLARRIEEFLELPPERIRELGAASRALVEREYGEEIVVGRYLEALAEINLPRRTGGGRNP
ncbi:MAG: glycosyltransferase family 4 protein [Allosphingosinicella sp.]